MEVHGEVLLEQAGTDLLAERDHHETVGLGVRDDPEDLRIVDRVGPTSTRRERVAVFAAASTRVDRGRRRASSSTGGAIGLGDDQRDVVPRRDADRGRQPELTRSQKDHTMDASVNR